MNKILLICGLLYIIAKVSAQDNSEKCKGVLNFKTVMCCKDKQKFLERPEEKGTMKECFQELNMTHDHHNLNHDWCPFDTCIAKKVGFVADDGTINEDALRNHIDEIIKVTELADKLKENCVTTEKLERFRFDDSCIPSMIKRCNVYYTMNYCPEWDDSDRCNDKKTLLEECNL